VHFDASNYKESFTLIEVGTVHLIDKGTWSIEKGKIEFKT